MKLSDALLFILGGLTLTCASPVKTRSDDGNGTDIKTAVNWASVMSHNKPHYHHHPTPKQGSLQTASEVAEPLASIASPSATSLFERHVAVETGISSSKGFVRANPTGFHTIRVPPGFHNTEGRVGDVLGVKVVPERSRNGTSVNEKIRPGPCIMTTEGPSGQCYRLSWLAKRSAFGDLIRGSWTAFKCRMYHFWAGHPDVVIDQCTDESVQVEDPSTMEGNGQYSEKPEVKSKEEEGEA